MFINIDGLNINYKETGDSQKTLIILQGWGTELSVYDSIAEYMSAQYRVIQFDFPGFGNSEEPKEAFDVDKYTTFFIRFMESLGVKSAVLLGHSYGGRVIIKLLNREDYSFNVERVVLVDSAGIMPVRSLMQKLKIKKYKFVKKIYNLSFMYKLFPDMIEQWKSKQGSEDYRNATPIMRETLVKSVNEDLTYLLPNINKEVLLIWGDMDTATPISDAKKMDNLIPDSGLAVIKGAGHYSFLDAPVLFKNILCSYLMEDK